MRRMWYSLEHKRTGELGKDFIYVLGTNSGLVKIGTTNDLWRRFRALRTMGSEKVTMLLFWRLRNGRAVEAAIHTMLRDYREHGEWFRLGNPLDDREDWKWQYLVECALVTSSRVPIPIHDWLVYFIQYGHIDSEDAVWKQHRSDPTGREYYPTTAFVTFDHKANADNVGLYSWNAETREMYGFDVDTPQLKYREEQVVVIDQNIDW